MVEIPQRYVPSYLTKKDKSTQIKELKKSRKAYRKSTKNASKSICRNRVEMIENAKINEMMSPIIIGLLRFPIVSEMIPAKGEPTIVPK